MTYAPVKFEVNTSSGGDNTFFDLDPKVNAIQNFVQFPQHYVSYAPAKFAVALSNGLGGDAFAKKPLWMDQ